MTFFFLQDNINDKWTWKHDSVEDYTVKGVYRILTAANELPIKMHSKLIWSKPVPFKVSLFAWRTIKNIIPTKGNLRRKEVLPANSIMCSGGCVQDESINHLLLDCDFFGCIWHFVHHWLDISTVVSSDIGCHAQQYFDAHAFDKNNSENLNVYATKQSWILIPPS